MSPQARTCIAALVLRTFHEVAREHGQNLPPLENDLALIECGLDSLSLAVVVARLEDALGVDPLATSEEEALPGTIADFIAMYESAAA